MTGEENKKFNELYKKHGDMVYGISLQYSNRNSYLAEDAVQYTFMKLFQAMGVGTEITNMESYLHSVAKNYILNSKKKTSKEFFASDNEDKDLLEVINRDSSAEEKYLDRIEQQENQIMLDRILTEMEEYNETWYKIITEVFQRERSQSEVAKELGMNDTAMYATIRRIRKWANRNRERIQVDILNEEKRHQEGISYECGIEDSHS